MLKYYGFILCSGTANATDLCIGFPQLGDKDASCHACIDRTLHYPLAHKTLHCIVSGPDDRALARLWDPKTLLQRHLDVGCWGGGIRRHVRLLSERLCRCGRSAEHHLKGLGCGDQLTLLRYLNIMDLEGLSFKKLPWPQQKGGDRTAATDFEMFDGGLGNKACMMWRAECLVCWAVGSSLVPFKLGWQQSATHGCGPCKAIQVFDQYGV